MKTDVIINRDALAALKELPSESSIAALQARRTMRCGTMGLTHKSDRRTRRNSILTG